MRPCIRLELKISDFGVLKCKYLQVNILTVGTIEYTEINKLYMYALSVCAGCICNESEYQYRVIALVPLRSTWKFFFIEIHLWFAM